jgi:TolB protein
MKSDGGGEKRLTNNTARDAYPSLSPDGTEMVLVSDRDGSTDLYIMSIDGAKTERLTSTPAKEHHPQWSPTGDQIACYVSTDGEKDQVLIIDAASGDSRVLGGAATKNTFPAWAADGQSVIYCSSPSESEKWIFQANLDGSKDDKLLPLAAFYAKYSPDGNRVAYIGGSWPSSNIYVIDYSDGTLRCLTCDMPLTPQPEQALANKKSKSGK